MAEDRVEVLEKQLAEMKKEFANTQKELKSFLDKALNEAEDVYEDGRDEAAHFFEKARRKGRKAWNEVQNVGGDWTDEVSSCVKKHPYSVAAVIGGLAVFAAIIYRCAEDNISREWYRRWR